jgi:hypothetical protein
VSFAQTAATPYAELSLRIRNLLGEVSSHLAAQAEALGDAGGDVSAAIDARALGDARRDLAALITRLREMEKTLGMLRQFLGGAEALLASSSD